MANIGGNQYPTYQTKQFHYGVTTILTKTRTGMMMSIRSIEMWGCAPKQNEPPTETAQTWHLRRANAKVAVLFNPQSKRSSEKASIPMWQAALLDAAVFAGQ